MNILFYGDGPWAHDSLRKIITSGEFNVKGVVLRYETRDSVLRRIAEDYGINVYVDQNVNSQDFVVFSKSLDLDLSISMSFNQIIKKELRETNRIGFINCHAGKLPYYRGRNILNWVLINDEKEFGVTAHFIDDGIDTGDIISQLLIPIEEMDNYNTLLKKAIERAPEVLFDAMIKIKSNRYHVIKQKHIPGTYFSRRRIGDEFINWEWSSRKIHNFVRALVLPAPGAQAFIKQKKVFIWETEETNIPKYISTPGEIIKIETDGIIVKTGDSAIKIKKISTERKPESRIPVYRTGLRFITAEAYKISLLEKKIVELEKRILR